MKGKIAILLSSIVAGLGLVGATFALWAVTDNANPLGIKVSPGTIGTGDSYDTITLDWGDTTSFTDIQNLGLGEANAVTKSLQVKSTTSNSSVANGGTLSVSLEDQTVRDNNDVAKLIDHLVVEVKKVVEPDPVAVGTINPSTVGRAFSEQVATTSGQLTTISFKVYIPTVFNTVELTSEQYNQMKNDVVYLKVDWNKPSAITEQMETDATMIYFKAPSAYDVKIHAWNHTTLKSNETGFGTVSMTHVSGLYYSYLLSEEYDRVLFVYANETQTADLEVTETIRTSTPMYDQSAVSPGWVTANIATPVYYLVGTMNSWTAVEDYKLTNVTDGVYSYIINSVPASFRYKVFDQANNLYYSYDEIGGGDNDCTWGTEGAKILIKFSPTKSLSGGTAYITNEVTA